MKKKILFVDDEPLILQGLQRMLRPMREEWDMVFVDGGEKALAAMEERRFDVVVSDMRMPVMNGAQLLTEIRRRHPMTVRLILSGHADSDLVAQCLGVAHQYISKPCDPGQLKAMIHNACLLGGGLVTDKVREVLGSVERLPVAPESFRKLEAALADPEVSTQDLARIIQEDPGMTAKMLKMVNSAFFGLRRTLSSPQDAVTYLGIDTIKALVLINSIFERAEPLPTRNLALGDLWRHSLAVANGAKALAQAHGFGRQQTDESYVGGILADVGILVLASNFPEAYDRAIEIVRAESVHLTTLELEEFAVTHAEVGAYLLGLWGLPAPVLQIVSLHHSPRLFREPGFAPEVGVYAADLLVGELGGHPVFSTGRFDMVSMTRLGLADQVEGWRATVGASGAG